MTRQGQTRGITLFAAAGVVLIGALAGVSEQAYSVGSDSYCLPWAECGEGPAQIDAVRSDTGDMKAQLQPQFVPALEWELHSVNAEQKVLFDPSGEKRIFTKIPWRSAWSAMSESGEETVIAYDAVRSRFILNEGAGKKRYFGLKPGLRDVYVTVGVQDESGPRPFERSAEFVAAAVKYIPRVNLTAELFYGIEKLLAAEFAPQPAALQFLTDQK